MVVEIQINNSANVRARYVTWAPSACRIRVTDPTGVPAPIVNLRLSSTSISGGGQVQFRQGSTGAFANSIMLNVPTNGT